MELPQKVSELQLGKVVGTFSEKQIKRGYKGQMRS
jgi:hypothetical protein